MKSQFFPPNLVAESRFHEVGVESRFPMLQVRNQRLPLGEQVTAGRLEARTRAVNRAASFFNKLNVQVNSRWRSRARSAGAVPVASSEATSMARG
jgi:hypothetical protein